MAERILPSCVRALQPSQPVERSPPGPWPHAQATQRPIRWCSQRGGRTRSRLGRASCGASGRVDPAPACELPTRFVTIPTCRFASQAQETYLEGTAYSLVRAGTAPRGSRTPAVTFSGDDPAVAAIHALGLNEPRFSAPHYGPVKLVWNRAKSRKSTLKLWSRSASRHPGDTHAAGPVKHAATSA